MQRISTTKAKFMNKQLRNVKLNKIIIQTSNDHFASQSSHNKQIF